ncbi:MULTISPECIES: hypothetical protein [Bacillus]|uniref:hypothetical protein n=1 Tax=Bacillus TaxID=1386 RepID=UPI0008FBA7A6|nr:hypothetical protein [Bacillus licheniformis]OIS74624.1 hypothetical protein A4A40_18800 [Bacillus licheniformis]OIS80649.1 hypothetical protein A4A43_09585 [Bacillus licheniformis]OIS82232.1 hypothetical protein A4A38_05550 [Bacillus licheniformis]OIS89975.1 hypothetical protein A4A42_00135 [Bacillus licheniformis]TWK91150.1 hypothetical protein CHCC20327_2527 [Bacillus licheniformis]
MSRINKTKEDKFKDSLKSWGPEETRPFIREKEDLVRDAFDYKRKYDKIKRERNEVAKITGDSLENINIWSSRGLESQSGPIKDWTPIKKEEE